MRKYAGFILLCAAGAVFLAGCGALGGQSSAASAPAQSVSMPETVVCTPSESQAPPRESSAANVSAPETTGQAGTLPPVAQQEIQVGTLYTGDLSDRFRDDYVHDQGIRSMQGALGLTSGQVIRKLGVDPADFAATESAARACVEEGADIVFATDAAFRDVCEALAEEFPDVAFCVSGSDRANDRNFSGYFGRAEEARYLSGVAAGLKTRTNKIGYVAAMNEEDGTITAGLNAFAMGAQSVSPDVAVNVRITGSLLDPVAEGNAAKDLIAEGCDVIAQHCGSAAPQQEAAKAGVWGIGYNADMSRDAPGATITSVLWNWDVYYTQAVQARMDGTWNPAIYSGGMAQGLVEIAPIAENLVQKGFADTVESVRKRMLDEALRVFRGEIATNNGDTVGEEGVSFTDAQIAEEIHWYYQNITIK